MNQQHKSGQVILLVGKVASGKTTYAREMEQQQHAIFLSIDELQIDLFGVTPTRKQLDTSYAGCCEYQKRLALKLVKRGFDLYLDWGFWERTARRDVRLFFENEGIVVKQYYFDIALPVRRARNHQRNMSYDHLSYKIQDKDIAFLDGFFEPPAASENDKILTS